MNLLKCKSRTLLDLWDFYPHRKNPPWNGSTIPLPYVKKQEVSDHKWAITYQTYIAVMTDIIEMIVERLSKGEKWNMGGALGEICLTKNKCKSFVDRIKSGQQGKQVKRFRNEYENYMIMPEWERLYFPIQNKWLWRFKIIPKILREIYIKAETDYTYIYKFRDK